MLDNFLFGTATSAYQIEGAWDEDNKDPSIWDEYSHHRKHYILNGHTGDIACDHYHRWKEDIAIMKALGIQAYRFSISWSRVWSKGKWNKKGIKFYKNIVNALIKADIEPFVTLYHWDLPLAYDLLGGWSNKAVVNAFSDYAHKMFVELPEVKYWITFNEPAVFVNNFWGLNDFPEAVRNVLLAHGKAVQAFRDISKDKIGISLNLIPVVPATSRSRDKQATDDIETKHNWLWLDPILQGCFPEDINRLYRFKNELFLEEPEIVSSPIDFLGINYYTGEVARYDARQGMIRNVPDKNAFKDEMGVEIHPKGIFILLDKLKKRYGNFLPDMYITENGCAFSDTLTHDGEVHDYRRIKYIHDHLFCCNKAVERGLNLKGYFYWSLMDNFEWRFGYTKRFGLLHVHYPTQERTPKDSALWYGKLIKDKKFRNNELR